MRVTKVSLIYTLQFAQVSAKSILPTGNQAWPAEKTLRMKMLMWSMNRGFPFQRLNTVPEGALLSQLESWINLKWGHGSKSRRSETTVCVHQYTWKCSSSFKMYRMAGIKGRLVRKLRVVMTSSSSSCQYSIVSNSTSRMGAKKQRRVTVRERVNSRVKTLSGAKTCDF